MFASLMVDYLNSYITYCIFCHWGDLNCKTQGMFLIMPASTCSDKEHTYGLVQERRN